MLYTISSSTDFMQPGNYVGTFLGVSTITTSRGEALRWEFRSDDGKTITGLSDAERPTVKNKLGRWLAALSTKPLTAGTQVEPSEYAGKKYMLIVSASDKGGKLETFSMLA